MQALLFDFGGTLDCQRHWLDRFVSHYRACGVEIARNELDPAYTDATGTAYRRAQQFRDCGLRELVRYLTGLQLSALEQGGSREIRSRLAKAAAGDLERLAAVIADNFVSESRDGLEQSREILSVLARRFKIGVVSNFYGNLERVLEEAGIVELLSTVADSSRLGIFKPAPGIFEFALDQLGLRPNQAAMIGDSLDKDCAPARNLGMRTVWLRHDGEKIEPTPSAADYVITSLAATKGISW